METLGGIFLPSSRQASCNYGIGADGRVGIYVEEKNRSWCSSSNSNDQRAVTIECASDATKPYAFKDAVYQTLIKLCVDICKRNGKSKLLWLGDKDKTLAYSPKSDEMVLTVHRWFANKSCPKDWLYGRLSDLAAKVTAELGGECGEFYRRVHWNNRGCKSIVWRCCSHLDNTGHSCCSRTVNETLLEQVAIDAINRVLCEKDDFLKTLQANIATMVRQGDTLSPEVIDERLRELRKELLKKANQKNDYDAISDEIFRLRDMRKQSEVDSVVKDEQMKQINDLQDFIRSQPTTITEFDEILVKKLISRITIFEDHFTVEFRSGITIEIEA